LTSPQPRLVGDRPVFPIALGGASWSLGDHPVYGGSRPPDEEQGIRTIHAALDAGVNMIDTARAYTTADHPGHSEALIARALATHPLGSKTLVATKGGHYREGNTVPVDISRDTVRRHCETSLELLGVDTIELYYLHHPDPEVPMADAMAPFAELREEGLIQRVGVSNVSIDQLEEAMTVVPVVAVQNRFSPFHQTDRELVDYCAEWSIAFLAYSPLSGGAGLLSGPARLSEAFPSAAALAERKSVSIQQLALAWLLNVSPTLIPISGASRPESIQDSVRAAALALTDDELAKLDFPNEDLDSVARVRDAIDRRHDEIAASLVEAG
jgi:aryl-alcohol dehydrogenase-like predicted oxidoreductase